ncbi:MAG: RNA polymerase sigma factor [Flavobacteriales bacterium]|nr:RNA polymerase sigma factor [Flavobacteriales bacterium]
MSNFKNKSTSESQREGNPQHDDFQTGLLAELRQESTRVAAFETLVRIYQEKLYGHLRRMTGNHPDADDALQNTLIKVWKNIETFRGDSALYSWLYRIAANEALDIIKKRKTGFGHVPAESAELTVPEKQRQVFDLKYFEEMKYDTIAEITGTSVGALKASYFHAVKKIEAFLMRGE